MVRIFPTALLFIGTGSAAPILHGRALRVNGNPVDLGTAG
jgi:hypothetical protein